MTFISPANTAANTSPRHIVGASIIASPSGSGHSTWNWRGPSMLDLGRIKSEAQAKKDAIRVNQHSDCARSSNSDATKRIVGRRNEARSQ